MATIEEALRTGRLDLFELPSAEDRLPQRPLYVTEELMDWADDTSTLHDVSKMVGNRTFFEHLHQAFCDFRCGKRPAGAGDIRRMMPTKKGIWSFHIVGLRIYGWCPAQHSFVAVTAALESETKTDRQLNGRKLQEVLAFAKSADLLNTIKLGDILALFPHKD